MNKKTVDYSLYLCTDRHLMSAATVEEAVEQAVAGGCTVVQLREKSCSSREFLELALRVRGITDSAGVPLIINDRVDIALASGAAGVHVGQSDLPADAVRRLMGPEGLVGVSVSCAEQAVHAVRDGADYLGVGAMYPTDTKKDTTAVSLEELANIRAAVDVPIVVIGGINKRTVPDFRGSGINGLAVVSAVIAQPDIRAAARELVTLFREMDK